MLVAKRDLQLQQIDKEIEKKQNALIQKKKELSGIGHNTEYLSEIQKDYEKYYNYILKEKQQQYEAMLLIKKYIGNLIDTEQLLDDHVRIAKYDQKNIVDEISKIRNEIDQLIK